MALLDDIKRLGLQLEKADRDEIDRIVKQVTRETKDEFVRNALIEGAVGEFLAAFCPDAMDAIIRDKEQQSNEWIRLSQRKFDKEGNRLCEEDFCSSTDEVAQCSYCGKYVCKEHNYLKDSHCCYACWVLHFGAAK
jgi:hypothetical protein